MCVNPLISVVVPIYNVENYIKECVRSILQQSYKNLEIILVNDGSRDKSITYCQEVTENDERVIYLSKENGGLSDARNFGTIHSKGEYIIFVDSDDIISRYCIEKLYTILVTSEADIAVGNYSKILDDTNYSQICLEDNWSNKYEVFKAKEAFGFIYSEDLHNCITFTTAWNKLYKTEMAKECPFPYGKKHEDEFNTYKKYMISKNQKIVYTNMATYFYRIRPNSIMTAPFNLQNLDILSAYEERIQLLEGYDEKLLLETEYHYIYYLSHCRKYLNKNNLKKHSKGLRKKQLLVAKKIFSKLDIVRKRRVIKWIIL